MDDEKQENDGVASARDERDSAKQLCGLADLAGDTSPLFPFNP
jgi:hypothetical protein